MLKVAFSPIYKYQLPEGHRFPMIKYELLPEQLVREGTLSEDQFFKPEPLDRKSILLTHTFDYLNKLHALPLPRKEERAIGFPVRDDLILRGKHIAGGTYECAKYALIHGISLNIAGGTHHAFADHGEGFCVFNDIAIAVNMLLRDRIVKKIIIVDLDVHQGNGTAHIFKNSEDVFTLSMHGARNYPLRKQASDLDIALEDGCGDRDYLNILEQHLPSTIELVRPDLIFYLAGVDILESDTLGRLSISRKGCLERDRFVISTCHRHNIPVAICMGGGYADKLTDIIEAHANTFRVAQELYF